MNESITPRPNRRLVNRLHAKSSAKVACRKGSTGLGKNLALRLLDVSETGVRLVVRERLDADQEVSLTLESPRFLRPLNTLGQVMWSIEMADNNFCIGVRFNDRLDYPVVERLA